MRRKLLSASIALLIVIGCTSLMVKADVTGSFSIRIEIEPIACGALPFTHITGTGTPPVLCENTMQKSDIEASLNVNWTISGLTLGISSVAGFTGVEHVLTTLKATLGVLNISDQFFFAVPFGTDTLAIGNGSNQTDNELAFTVITNNLLFVKKRVEAIISIAGITLDNLAELGDITFPSAIGTIPCAENGIVFGTPDKCPLLPPQSAFPTGYTAASQTFRFGDTLTISGQTVSGITVTNITAIDMDPQLFEEFKKISFAGVLCNNTDLQFAVEKIQLQSIPVGPVTVSEFLEFRFGAQDANCIGNQGATPFSALTDLSVTTLIGELEAILSTHDITQQLFNGALITLSSGGFTIQQVFTSTLGLLLTRATLATTLNPESNPATLKIEATICQEIGTDDLFTNFDCDATGLRRIDTTLSVQRSGLTFTGFTRLSGGPPIALSRTHFTVSATAGAVNLSALIQLPLGTDPWMGVFTAGVNF